MWEDYVRRTARKIYVETAPIFDLGYVQVPLIRKILERIVQQYGFKATLDVLKSALAALDASMSAEVMEKLNVIILFVGIYTVIVTLLETRWRVEYYILVAAAIFFVLPLLLMFGDDIKSIYNPKRLITWTKKKWVRWRGSHPEEDD
ncbi:MAG: hypothetical protein ACP5ID_05020 [Conexivisphaera sp.]